MVIVDTPKVKSRNLDVVAEYNKVQHKNSLNFVVIGHVDAGKSTLMGRLLLDLGVYDQRLLMKNQKEADQLGKGSFALAWMMDQGVEERERGVTIDIAQNKFETDKTQFTILDAPGHRDFIPNMIAGAAQADFAVLVIDSTTGAFESGLKGQTKEHALLARSIGVTRLVIAVNKLDSKEWSRERFEEIETQMGTFLTTAGFQSKNITFVPCSGLTGDNVTHKSTSKDASWYTGPILLEALEQSTAVTRAIDGPLRLPITDVFRGGVQNPLSISGRIDSGSLQVGDTLLVVPGNNQTGVRGIEVNHEPADFAVAGQNVTIHLGDIDPAYLRTGDILCSLSEPLQSVKEFGVKVLVFSHIMPQQIDVHRGRLHVPARVSHLKALLDKASGQVSKKKPRVVKPGEVATLHIEIEGEQSIPLEKGMKIILRAGGDTLASGIVE